MEGGQARERRATGAKRRQRPDRTGGASRRLQCRGGSQLDLGGGSGCRDVMGVLILVVGVGEGEGGVW